MSEGIDSKRAVLAMCDHMEIVLDRRRTQGELAMPSFLAALELLEIEDREFAGTLLRDRFLDRLASQNATKHVLDQMRAEHPPDVIDRACAGVAKLVRKALRRPEPEPIKEVALPSFADEIRYLFANADRDSPTQCFLVSEMYAKWKMMDEAREWYTRGLQAARELSELYPYLSFPIYE